MAVIEKNGTALVDLNQQLDKLLKEFLEMAKDSSKQDSLVKKSEEINVKMTEVQTVVESPIQF